MYRWDIVRSFYNGKETRLKHSIEAEDVCGAIRGSIEYMAHIPEVRGEHTAISDMEFAAYYDGGMYLLYRRME
jgi:hypothetical protein